MKGYLLKEKTISISEANVIESSAPENLNMVVFEDDGETGYFYAAEHDGSGEVARILDMLYIYDAEAVPPSERSAKLAIIWSRDWQRCALVIDDVCHAVFDFEAHGGYNLAAFPPPNALWTKQPRQLTKEMVTRFFG